MSGGADRAVSARRGWSRAWPRDLEDIAARAGVAVPTVYKAFTSKRNLLAAAVATAMTGGPDGPVDRQAWFQEQLDAPTAELQLQLIARNARRLNDRAGQLLELVRAAAARDSEIAALWRDINNERLARSRTSAQRLAAKATLRTSVPGAAHTLWALTVPEVYVLHVKESGLRPDAYQHWLADLLIAVLLAQLRRPWPLASAHPGPVITAACTGQPAARHHRRRRMRQRHRRDHRLPAGRLQRIRLRGPDRGQQLRLPTSSLPGCSGRADCWRADRPRGTTQINRSRTDAADSPGSEPPAIAAGMVPT